MNARNRYAIATAVTVVVLTACGATAPVAPLVPTSAQQTTVTIDHDKLETAVKQAISVELRDGELRCPDGDAEVHAGSVVDCPIVMSDGPDRIARVTFLDETGRFEAQVVNP